MLVAYPLLVALLVALALQSDERRPDVALVVEDTSGRSVQVGDRRLSIDDYVERLSEDVDVRRLDAEAAATALDEAGCRPCSPSPRGSSGTCSPACANRCSGSPRAGAPIEADAIERRLEAAVFRLNQSLATGYVDQVLRLVDLVIEGGEIGPRAQRDALGLRRSRVLVRDVQRSCARPAEPAARRSSPRSTSSTRPRGNLDLARPAANAIRAPIEIEVPRRPSGREPLSAFGFAGALLVSLGLAGVLLAAAAMSSEREDHALARLRRGLISSPSLVAEKMAFTASACLVVGLLLLAGVALFTSLAVGRWGLWLIALILAGLAFRGVRGARGALARETRTALLVALMLALPLLALGLLPDSPVASAISQAVPFGPAFDAFQTLLVEPTISAGDLTLTLGTRPAGGRLRGRLATWAVSHRSAA